MKNLIKTVIKEILSIFKTAYYLIRGTLHFVNDIISGRYMKLPDNNKQDTVLILGNGPSLNDLELLDYIKRDFKIATVNFFPAKYDLFF